MNNLEEKATQLQWINECSLSIWNQHLRIFNDLELHIMSLLRNDWSPFHLKFQMVHILLLWIFCLAGIRSLCVTWRHLMLCHFRIESQKYIIRIEQKLVVPLAWILNVQFSLNTRWKYSNRATSLRHICIMGPSLSGSHFLLPFSALFYSKNNWLNFLRI